jgi:hypothetical protein
MFTEKERKSIPRGTRVRKITEAHFKDLQGWYMQTTWLSDEELAGLDIKELSRVLADWYIWQFAGGEFGVNMSGLNTLLKKQERLIKAEEELKENRQTINRLCKELRELKIKNRQLEAV